MRQPHDIRKLNFNHRVECAKGLSQPSHGTETYLKQTANVMFWMRSVTLLAIYVNETRIGVLIITPTKFLTLICFRNLYPQHLLTPLRFILSQSSALLFYNLPTSCFLATLLNSYIFSHQISHSSSSQIISKSINAYQNNKCKTSPRVYVSTSSDS